MADLSKMNDYLAHALDLELGRPILDVADKEKVTIQYAIELGEQDYWRCCPYIHRVSYPLSGAVATSLRVSFDDIVKGLSKEVVDEAYFLGIVRTDVAIGAFNQGLYSFDQYLLGFNVRQRTLDPLKQVLAATINDQVTGQVRYNINRVEKVIDYVLPVTIGQLIVDYGIGFHNRLDYIPQSHLEILTKFCAIRLLNSIIISRSAVTTTADYTISTAELKARLDNLEKEIEVLKANYFKLPMIFD